MASPIRLILSFAATTLLIAALSLSAKAECEKPPKAPQMPQGATATDDEMKAGHDALQKYVNILEAYETCLNAEIKNAPPDMKPEDKKRLIETADAAIEAAHEIADIYAIQLRAFKARE
jgi:hypothetical protein